jgi:hypothetical protein
VRQDGVGPEDDELLTSLAQFDALSNVVAVDGSGDVSGRDFYPSFSRYYAHRVRSIIERLITNEEMRRELFQRDNEDLAIAHREIGARARSEGWRYDGFDGWGPVIEDFITANVPASQ